MTESIIVHRDKNCPGWLKLDQIAKIEREVTCKICKTRARS